MSLAVVPTNLDVSCQEVSESSSNHEEDEEVVVEDDEDALDDGNNDGEVEDDNKHDGKVDLLLDSFIKYKSKVEMDALNDLQMDLDEFLVQHAMHHRPLALVSSGGTAADLERTGVRCLENFSTGLRGAIAVEEFLKHGYAVVHLWRPGTASPYARIIHQTINDNLSSSPFSPSADYPLDVDNMGKLFNVGGGDDDQEDDLVRLVLSGESVDAQHQQGRRKGSSSISCDSKNNSDDDEVALHRSLLNSSRLRNAIQERTRALDENRLFTVHFRSVEDYLSRLRLCAKAVKDVQSLAVFLLAAAVSDFYIPMMERPKHKISSASQLLTKDDGDHDAMERKNDDDDDDGGLTLKLKPVPKVMGLLRRVWAPDAFLVSFKLETDMNVLRSKSERAVKRYGCNLVIGNRLQNRYEKIWILAPEHQNLKIPTNAEDWSFKEMVRSNSNNAGAKAGASKSKTTRSIADDSLEMSMIDFVVKSHFEYISYHDHDAGIVGDLSLSSSSGPLPSVKAHRRIRV